MTELEKQFKKFRDNADETYPKIDDEFRTILEYFTNDNIHMTYNNIDDYLKVDFHNTKTGEVFYSSYENPHLVMFALSSAMSQLVDIEQLNDVVTFIKNGGDLGELIVDTTNRGISIVQDDSEKWREVCI